MGTDTESVAVRFAEGMTSDGLTVTNYHQSRSETLTLDLLPTTTDSPVATMLPTHHPTNVPTMNPMETPSANPTTLPTHDPTNVPSTPIPTLSPTVSTQMPTNIPTASPTEPSQMPTQIPSKNPTVDEGEYELCVEFGGEGEFEDVTLEIHRNVDTEMMRIQITGHNEGWFGFGFGRKTMPGTYAVIGSGTTFGVTERTLGLNSGGLLLSSSGDSTVLEDDDSRTVILERPYNVHGTYDFTHFLRCSTSSLSVMSAEGFSKSFGYHSGRAVGTATNKCCEEEETINAFELKQLQNEPVIRNWIIVFVVATCAFCAVAAFCLRKRQKRLYEESVSEMQRITSAVDERRRIYPDQIEIGRLDDTVRPITN